MPICLKCGLGFDRPESDPPACPKCGMLWSSRDSAGMPPPSAPVGGGMKLSLALVLVSLGLQLLFPPLRLVTPVNVVGLGLSHYGTARADPNGGPAERTRFGFAPAKADVIVCDLGHFPVWYAARRSGEDRTVNLYSATVPEHHLKGYGFALHESAALRLDWVRLCGEEALVLSVCACVIARRQRR